MAAIRERLGLSVPRFADRLGVKLSTVRNWVYGQSNAVPDDVLARARAMAQGRDVGPPLVPASQLLIPVPYIGGVAASSEVNWVDPFESETLEYVPPEMGDAKGRFCCTVLGDSMYDLLYPGDLAVFQHHVIPRLGSVVLFRSFDNRITVKTLRHDGRGMYLHPENSEYEDIRAEGSQVGFLVGIVRQIGSRRVTVYDPNGIRP